MVEEVEKTQKATVTVHGHLSLQAIVVDNMIFGRTVKWVRELPYEQMFKAL